MWIMATFLPSLCLNFQSGVPSGFQRDGQTKIGKSSRFLSGRLELMPTIAHGNIQHLKEVAVKRRRFPIFKRFVRCNIQKTPCALTRLQ